MKICEGCKIQINKQNKYNYCWKCYCNSDIRKEVQKKIINNRKSFLGKNNPNFRGKTKFICKCGKDFFRRVSPSQIGKNYHKYCSVDCKHKYSVSKAKYYSYKNIKLRSSWELEFAKYLDSKGYKWYYEPKTFKTEYGYYTPDFYVEDLNTYFEVKGYFRDENAFNKFNYFKENNNIILADRKYFEELGYTVKKGLLVKE